MDKNKKVKKQILKYGLIFLMIANSFFAWRSIEKAINVSASSDWIVPIVLFSSFFILLYLSAILIEERYFIYVALLFCLSLSFIFVLVNWHFASVLIGFLLASFGIYHIRRDLGLNIKINLSKIIYAGKTFVIIGIAIVISSQYFYTIKDKDLENLLPKIQSSRTFDMMTSKFLAFINPDFKNISGSSTTVDEFIIETQRRRAADENIATIPDDQLDASIEAQMGSNLSLQQKEELKKNTRDRLKDMNSELLENNQQIILEESRKNLSEVTGKKLTGQEKVSEIFPQMINKKIVDYFRPKADQNDSLPLLPVILAIILFLTIVPIGSFLNIFWTLLSRLIFWILSRTGAISIGKIQKDVEMIE